MMKKVTNLVLLLLATAVSTAPAQTVSILHMTGNSWETGGFPPSVLGDSLTAVGILTDIDDPLIWDTATHSYTWYIRDLISLGSTIVGTTEIVTYEGGLLTFYVDVLPSNHDYDGLNGGDESLCTPPPNDTSPSTFTDSSGPYPIYLEAEFNDFLLTFNHATSSGNMVGTLTFTGGEVFPMIKPDGWVFGADIAGFSPCGYDLHLNADVYLQVPPVSVEENSWGAIKGLYR